MKFSEIEKLFSSLSIALNVEPYPIPERYKLEAVEALAFKLLDGATSSSAFYHDYPWEKEQTIYAICRVLNAIRNARDELTKDAPS